MANTFLDTSALGKHYHPEVGSAKVDDLLRARHIRRHVGGLEPARRVRHPGWVVVSIGFVGDEDFGGEE